MSQPLISDAALRGMYITIRQLRGTGGLQQLPVAVLAASLSQLHRRDTVLVPGDARLLQSAAGTWFHQGNGPSLHSLEGTDEECAAIAAGVALRIADWARPTASTAAAGQGTPMPVAIALLKGFPALPALRQLIQDHDLPLLLFAGGPPEPRAKSQQYLLSAGVPTLLVDCTDAVALCRVTQECLLRARNGWGGAVIHAAPLPGSADPLHLLEQHLRNRGVQIP